MVEYVLPSELNQTGGIENLFSFVSTNVNNFMALLFLFIFFIIVASGYNYQKRNGKADITAWLSIGGFIVTVISVIASLVPVEPPLFPIQYVIIELALTFAFMLWFLISNAFNEG